jgi:hypothetical protein
VRGSLKLERLVWQDFTTGLPTSQVSVHVRVMKIEDIVISSLLRRYPAGNPAPFPLLKGSKHKESPFPNANVLAVKLPSLLDHGTDLSLDQKFLLLLYSPCPQSEGRKVTRGGRRRGPRRGRKKERKKKKFFIECEAYAVLSETYANAMLACSKIDPEHAGDERAVVRGRERSEKNQRQKPSQLAFGALGLAAPKRPSPAPSFLAEAWAKSDFGLTLRKQDLLVLFHV